MFVRNSLARETLSAVSVVSKYGRMWSENVLPSKSTTPLLGQRADAGVQRRTITIRLVRGRSCAAAHWMEDARVGVMCIVSGALYA